MLLSKLQTVMAVLFFISLVPAGIGGLSFATLGMEKNGNRQEAQPKQKETKREDIQDARMLVERAQELDSAKARYKQAEADLKAAQRNLDQAQQRYEEVQEHYEVAKGRGTGYYPTLPHIARSEEGPSLSGRLLRVNPKENTIGVEYWKEVRGDGRPFKAIDTGAYEDFSVAKDATILQDKR